MTKKQLIENLDKYSRRIHDQNKEISELNAQIARDEATYSASMGALRLQIAALEMAVEVYKEIIGTMRGMTKISPRDKGE